MLFYYHRLPPWTRRKLMSESGCFRPCSLNNSSPLIILLFALHLSQPEPVIPGWSRLVSAVRMDPARGSSMKLRLNPSNNRRMETTCRRMNPSCRGVNVVPGGSIQRELNEFNFRRITATPRYMELEPTGCDTRLMDATPAVSMQPQRNLSRCEF
jgi:hypothetical protein